MTNEQIDQVLRERIAELAYKYCADYPEIETREPLEQLYAIEGALAGVHKATEDWAAFAKYLVSWKDPAAGDKADELLEKALYDYRVDMADPTVLNPNKYQPKTYY